MENTTESITEKPASKNRRTLQRKAADLMMAGHSAHEVAGKLGVRFDTIARWQKSRAYIERINVHKVVVHEEIALDMVRAMRETGRYVVDNPNGKLGNTMESLIQIAKLSQRLGI